MTSSLGQPACARFNTRLEDALDERQIEALASDPHFASCAACREALEAFRALDAILASEPVAEPPAELSGLVIARVATEAARSRRRAKLSLVGTAAAAVVLALGIDVVAAPLRSGFERLLEDARALGARADSLSLDELPSLEAPRGLALPQAPSGFAALAIAGALGLAAAEVAWLRRRPAKGGAA